MDGFTEMDGFTDIHSHIIPGIDDGAKDMETAEEMLRLSVVGGTSHIIATPHFIIGSINNTTPIVEAGCRKLQSAFCVKNREISIHTGCEAFISPELPELYDKDMVSTLGGSRYMLVELPMMSIPDYTDEVLYKLQLRGLVPVIAHPERYRDVQRKPGILKERLKRGMLFQINSGSITGLFGSEVQITAMKLIEAGMAHFAASDAHTCRGRSPDLTKAAAIVEKAFGTDMVDRLFRINGMTVLNNGVIPSEY